MISQIRCNGSVVRNRQSSDQSMTVSCSLPLFLVHCCWAQLWSISDGSRWTSCMEYWSWSWTSRPAEGSVQHHMPLIPKTTKRVCGNDIKGGKFDLDFSTSSWHPSFNSTCLLNSFSPPLRVILASTSYPQSLCIICLPSATCSRILHLLCTFATSTFIAPLKLTTCMALTSNSLGVSGLHLRTSPALSNTLLILSLIHSAISQVLSILNFLNGSVCLSQQSSPSKNTHPKPPYDHEHVRGVVSPVQHCLENQSEWRTMDSDS